MQQPMPVGYETGGSSCADASAGIQTPSHTVQQSMPAGRDVGGSSGDGLVRVVQTPSHIVQQSMTASWRFVFRNADGPVCSWVGCRIRTPSHKMQQSAPAFREDAVSISADRSARGVQTPSHLMQQSMPSCREVGVANLCRGVCFWSSNNITHNAAVSAL